MAEALGDILSLKDGREALRKRASGSRHGSSRVLPGVGVNRVELGGHRQVWHTCAFRDCSAVTEGCQEVEMGGLVVGSPVPMALTSCTVAGRTPGGGAPCNLVSMCPVAGGGEEQEAASQEKAAPWG